MQKTPKSLRLHISIFGRRNVGKSSLMNRIVNQEVSIVSETPGTTTDPVEKTMEMLPIGPVVLIDTAGIDDVGDLGGKRIEKTENIIDRTDIAVIVCDYDGWCDYEKSLFQTLSEAKIPVIAIINKSDEKIIAEEKLAEIQQYIDNPISISAQNDNDITAKLKQLLIEKVPEDFINPPPIVGDILNSGDFVVLVIPIDKEAPKGRLILPQVQTLRDLLDNGCQTLVVRETELAVGLKSLTVRPKLVITDSQAFKSVAEIVPKDIMLTSFSILFARLKGDLQIFVEGVKTIDKLEDGDKVLFCESCTHHQIEDDIAQVKIPRWLREKTGKNLIFEYHSSHDFPKDVSQYKLIIHCGGCMTNRREILSRVVNANAQNVQITNYGLVISYCLGILDRALEPFS